MADRLKKSLLYTYGIGDLFFALMVNMEAYFFAVFLTDYARFSLAITGQILGLTSLIDIVCALVGGVILQKVTLKYGGKYRSWFLVGPPMVAPLFILQFTKIGGDLTAACIVMFGFIASHLLFNVVVAASGAMVSRLSQFPDERTILSTSRAQGMSAAGLILSATAMPMILFFSSHTGEVAGFTVTVAVYAFLMILGYWYVYGITARKDPYDEIPIDTPRNKSSQSVREIVGLVFRNPPLMYLTLAQVFGSTSIFIITALAIYYFTYVVGQPAFLSLFILATSIARLIGTLAASWIGVKLGKRNVYCIFITAAAVGFASGLFLRETPWGFTFVFCISSMLAVIAAAMNTALFADTVVYGEWKTGKSIRAFTMALMNLSIKVGVLIRSAVVTFGLMAIGFEANTTPTPRVIEGISLMITLGPAVAYAIAVAIFFFGYRIDEAHVLQMQQEITERKNALATNYTN
ncbi:MAG: MFS transporter [Acidobacteria bacterium]|nr:MFS transporter [Acidobacteriota bacterium]